MHSGIIAAIAVIFARYVAFFYPLGEIGIKVVAISVILLLSIINYLGVKQGSRLQLLFTLGKVLAVVFIIVAGFVLGSRVSGHFVAGGLTNQGVSFQSFFLALVAGLFAFGGWHMVTYNSEETIDPKKTIPRALMLGTLIVTFCYIAMNAVYMYVLPLDKVASSTRIAADAANALIGFATFGALNGIILCGPRVYYSMAQDGLLFRWVGDIHPKYRTPHKAIFLQAIWSAVLVATGTYRVLFTRVVYTEWIFFALMAFGLYVFRQRPGIVRGYKIWGYPVVPAIFIIFSLAIVVNQLVSDPRESLFGLVIVMLGLPVYYLWGKRSRKECES
jgi:APA family basic amino acid/polyamine antiporter